MARQTAKGANKGYNRFGSRPDEVAYQKRKSKTSSSSKSTPKKTATKSAPKKTTKSAPKKTAPSKSTSVKAAPKKTTSKKTSSKKSTGVMPKNYAPPTKGRKSMRKSGPSRRAVVTKNKSTMKQRSGPSRRSIVTKNKDLFSLSGGPPARAPTTWSNKMVKKKKRGEYIGLRQNFRLKKSLRRR